MGELSETEESLLDALADLVAKVGGETFLSAPLLEPTPRFFPDPYTPDARGARMLVRRLLLYAGLEKLLPEVHLDESAGVHADYAAWFSGMNLGICVVGMRQDLLSRPDELVAAICHEVAHAYRAVHRLVEGDRAFEEQLTDVTTVYLGFGVLTTNATYLYRTSGHMEGRSAILKTRETRLGYLSPPEMSFLLAAQAVARGESVRRIRRLLEANQGGLYASACKRLKKTDVRSRLGLRAAPLPAPTMGTPAPLTDDAPPQLSDALAAQPSSTPLERAGQLSSASLELAGQPGFSVIGRRKLVTGLKWCLLAGLATTIVAGLVGVVGDRLNPSFSLLVIVCAGLAGMVQGHFLRDDRCADCDAQIKVDALSCPGCGAVFRGTLASRQDRLAAREELGG